MAATRISVRIGPEVIERLREEAASTGKKPSQIVREALEDRLQKRSKKRTMYDAFLEAGLIGAAGPGLPRDLSTNKKYFEGFGQSRHPGNAPPRGAGRRPRKPTPYELLLESGFVGSIKGGPSDVSTNKKYFEGFGARRRARPARHQPTGRRSKRA